MQTPPLPELPLSSISFLTCSLSLPLSLGVRLHGRVKLVFVAALSLLGEQQSRSTTTEGCAALHSPSWSKESKGRAGNRRRRPFFSDNSRRKSSMCSSPSAHLRPHRLPRLHQGELRSPLILLPLPLSLFSVLAPCSSSLAVTVVTVRAARSCRPRDRPGTARRPATSGIGPAWRLVWAGQKAGWFGWWPGLVPGLGRPPQPRARLGNRSGPVWRPAPTVMLSYLFN